MLVQDASINDINIENVVKDPKAIPINQAAIDELGLEVDKQKDADLKQISKILKEILDYPDLQIAEIHSQAMKLGNFDLQTQQYSAKARLDTSSSMLTDHAKSQFCPCCGFKRQEDTIKVCTPFNSIKNMGLSTYLFFATFKNLSILLTILTIIYSAYSLATNILASNVVGSSILTDYSKIDYINISLSSKQTNDTSANRMYYYVSCWLGVANVIIWLLVIIAIKYNEVKDSNQYDQDTISCSDYTIVMEGLPLNVKLEELQKQFDQYYQTTIKNNSRFPQIWRKPLKVAKMNVGKPFYLHQDELKDEEIEQIEKEMAQIKQEVANWIIERQSSREFKASKSEREARYERYGKLVEKKMAKCTELTNKITSILKKDSGQRQDLTNVFVTFQLNNSKTILNFIHDSGILSRIRGLCSAQHQRFTYNQDGKEYRLRLLRAPQPQDVIWTNIGQRNCVSYLKKLFTFSITMVLLGISFAIVFGLTKLQQSKNDDRIVSIAISVTIGVVNAIIGQAIRGLTTYEKDYTETERQASLAIKSILAQMVNSIIIPVITAYYIKGNLYRTSGLVDNIFMLSITTSILPPILVFFDPYVIFLKLMRCLKSRPTSKLSQNQKEHNQLHEGPEFEVGYHYIYIVNVFIFICYFVSLQPIVSLIGLVGYFLMYWAQKYCMFNRYRRPVPGTDFVNNAVYRIILIGPFVYSLGSLTWSNFTPGGIPPEALIPNLAAVGIAVLIFIFPYNSIILGSCFANNYEKNKNYDDQRIIFPSQFDRLNPSTQQEGIEDYKKYLQRKMKEIKEMSEEKRAQFAQKFMANAQRAQAVQRGNNVNIPNYIPYRPYAPAQQMQGYQGFPIMSFSPFAAGFNPSAFGMMPRVGYAPMPYQQQRPMAPPMYPPVVIPPPVIYQQPQKVIATNQVGPMGYPQQMNPNQQRPMVQQPMMQPYQNNMPMQYPQPPMNQVNPMNIISQGIPSQINPMNQMNPAALNFGINMNTNASSSRMGLNGSQANKMNNRGW